MQILNDAKRVVMNVFDFANPTGGCYYCSLDPVFRIISRVLIVRMRVSFWIEVSLRLEGQQWENLDEEEEI